MTTCQRPSNEVKGAILQLVSTFPVPARTAKFVVADELSVGIHGNLRIAHHSSEFSVWFNKKVEGPAAAESKLEIHKLTKDESDAEILKHLGDTYVKATWAELHTLLVMQGCGQKGFLLNNGWANVAYVPDVKGIVRAVSIHWRSDGWHLGARLIGHWGGWFTGHQFVSRK